MDPQFIPATEAAYAGDLELFKSLLVTNPELITQTSTDRGDSPNLIQFIVVEGGLGKIPNAVNFLTFLIDNGSTTNRQLVAAASVNARELVDILIQTGVPISDGEPWTAVEESLYWGHKKMADYLINSHGAKVNTLCSAAMMGDLEAVASFFKNGKLIDSVLPVYFPWGPLDDSTKEDAMDQAFVLALRHKQYNTATYLLDHQANINAVARAHHEECTALHHAAFSNDFELVDWLIDRGAVCTVKDRRFNDTAIGWANHQGHVQMVRHLEKLAQ